MKQHYLAFMGGKRGKILARLALECNNRAKISATVEIDDSSRYRKVVLIPK